MHRVIYDELVQDWVGPDDSPVPIFETTRIHGEAAVERALSGHRGAG